MLNIRANYLKYMRRFLVVILIGYVVLTWMYYRDNVAQLTGIKLLLAFIIMPLILLMSIMGLAWYQKKRDATKSNPQQADKVASTQVATLPEVIPLFVTSAFVLPAGDNMWAVVDNQDDLSKLSEQLVNDDGLPLLVQPIKAVEDDVQSYHDETYEDTEGLSLRLVGIVKNLIAQKQDDLMMLASVVEGHHTTSQAEPNRALTMHPDWQQSYISSELDDLEEAQPVLPCHILDTLDVYLWLSDDVSVDDVQKIEQTIIEQLLALGFPEGSVKVTLLSDFSVAEYPELTCMVQAFYQEVQTIAKQDKPSACLMLALQSQIHEEWVSKAQRVYGSNDLEMVPTEGGGLVLFLNTPAQLALKNAALPLKTTSIKMLQKTPVSSKLSYGDYKQQLNGFERFIEGLLQRKAEQADKLADKSESEGKDVKQAILDAQLLALSNLNPVKQKFEVSFFMQMIDGMMDKGLVVDEWQLGHYLIDNHQFKELISLSLFIDATIDNKLGSELVFLVNSSLEHGHTFWFFESS